MPDTMTLVEIEAPRTVRLPGDFRRAGANGPPFVLDPTGALTKAGKVRSKRYGRPSGFHEWIDNGYNLKRWNERMVAIGTSLMVADGELNGPLDTLDGDGAGKQADEVVARAKHLAGAVLAADRGTAFHEATHALHDAEHAEQDIIAVLGDLGFPPEVVAAVLDSYHVALDRWGLEVLLSEVRCVDDAWRLAGTIDRIARTTRDLIFGATVVPAGTVLVLDLKTGQLRVKDGRPEYWAGYSVQVASYAQSVRYVIDGDDERREAWPEPIDQEHALILHLNIAGALDTEVATASLWRVDLAHGRALGELACQARDAAAWTAPFEQLGEGPVATTVDWGGKLGPLEQQLVESLRAEMRTWLQQRIDAIGRHERARADLIRNWPPGVPPLRHDTRHDDEALAVIEQVLDAVETFHSLPFGPSRPVRQRPGSWLPQLLSTFPNTTIQEQ